jgi:hypothetical protein
MNGLIGVFGIASPVAVSATIAMAIAFADTSLTDTQHQRPLTISATPLGVYSKLNLNPLPWKNGFCLCEQKYRESTVAIVPDDEPPESIALRIARLDNSRLQWNFGTFGITPVLDSSAAETVQDATQEHTDLLVEMLHHENQFAIAHVILTRLCAQSFPIDKGWNGLRVNALADGTWFYEQSAAQCQAQWQNYFHSHGR